MTAMPFGDPYAKYGIEALRFADRINFQGLSGEARNARQLALAVYGATPLLQETVLAHVNRIRRREVAALLQAWAEGVPPNAAETAAARAALLGEVRALAEQGSIAGLQFEMVYFDEAPAHEKKPAPSTAAAFDLAAATPAQTVDYWFALVDRVPDREMALDAALDAQLDSFSRAALEAVLGDGAPDQLDSCIAAARAAWLEHHAARFDLMRTGLCAIAANSHPDAIAAQLAECLGEPSATVYLLEIGQGWAFPQDRIGRMPPLNRATPPARLAAHLVAFAWMARKLGRLSLEGYAEAEQQVGEPYLRLGLQLISDGQEYPIIERLLAIRRSALLSALALKADMLRDFLAAMADGAHPRTARDLMRAYLPE